MQALVNNGSHLASTYCALAILKIVGYNFSCVNSKSILTSMRNLQQPDGRYAFTVLVLGPVTLSGNQANVRSWNEGIIGFIFL